MNRMALLLGALLVAGCAGTHFTFDRAREVRVGMSEAEVRSIMGRPTVISSSGGQIKWIYSFGSALGNARAVSYVFQDGQVIDVPEIPASFK